MVKRAWLPGKDWLRLAEHSLYPQIRLPHAHFIHLWDTKSWGPMSIIVQWYWIYTKQDDTVIQICDGTKYYWLKVQWKWIKNFSYLLIGTILWGFNNKVFVWTGSHTIFYIHMLQVPLLFISMVGSAVENDKW